MINHGIVGVGHMGEYHVNLCKKLNDMKRIKFVGIFDIDKRRADYIGKKYGIEVFSTFEDLLKEVDSITCSVSTTSHYDIAKKCIENNKHVLIEKPFTHSYKLACELANYSHQKDLIIQVGHIERFNGAIVELRKKHLREPTFIEAKRMNLRVNKKRDTGVILDLMIHDLDIVMNFMKQKKVAGINCMGNSIYTDFEDIANASIQFEDGSIANFITSRVAFVKNRSLEIQQKQNQIMLNFDSQEIEIYKKSNKIFEVEANEILYQRGGFIDKISVHVENPLMDEIKHFFDCIEKKQKPLVDTEDDLNVMRLAMNLIMKAKKNNDFYTEVNL